MAARKTKNQSFILNLNTESYKIQELFEEVLILINPELLYYAQEVGPLVSLHKYNFGWIRIFI